MIDSATFCRNTRAPEFWRRLAAMVYEALLLVAVWFFATLFYLQFRDPQAEPGLLYFRLYLLVVSAAYFTWFWTHGGQTLAMKTWRIRLVDVQGRPLGLPRATARFFLAVLGFACLGLGFLWALWDRESQFLHDRLAGSRLVSVVPPRR